MSEEGNISYSSESEEYYIIDDITIKEEPIEPIDLSSDTEEELVLSHEDEMALQEAADAAIAAWLATIPDEDDVGDPAKKRLREADHEDIVYLGEVKRKAIQDGDRDQEERQDKRERDHGGCPDCRIM